MRRGPTATPARVALLGVAAAALLAGWALRDALVLEPLPAAARATAPRPAAAAGRRAALPRDYLSVAVESAPFHPLRQPPGERFRMPGEEIPIPVEDATAPPPAPAATLRLLGTMLLPEGGGMAMVQAGGAPPRLVRIGETVGEWTLQSVGRRTASFVDPSGARTQIDVPEPGAR